MRSERRRRRGQDEHGAISIMAAVLTVAMLLATSLAVDVGRVAFTSRDQQGVTDRAIHDALRHLETADTDGNGTPDIDEAFPLEHFHGLVVDSVEDTLTGNTEGSSVGTARDRQADIIEIGYMDPSCSYEPQTDQATHEPRHEQLRALEGFCLLYGQQGENTYGPYDGSYVPTTNNGPFVTAVRVATGSTVDYVFGFLGGDGERDVVKQAVGTNERTATGDDCPPPPTPDPCMVDAEAGISVRSRLVELDTDDSGLDDSREEILQQLLGQLIGVSDGEEFGEVPEGVEVDAVGFDGLANATVPLGVLGDAGATVGTTEDLLDSRVTLTDLFSAMASLSSEGSVEAEALDKLWNSSADADPDWDIRVGDLISTTTEDPAALLTAQVNTLDLVVQAALHAELANGDHFAQVTLDSGLLGFGGDVLGLDGLSSMAVQLEVIEGPQMAYGAARHDPEDGYETVAQTAQVELDVTLEMDTDKVEDLMGPTLTGLLDSLLCLPLLGDVTCPSSQVATIGVAGANSEAELAGVECMDPDAETDLTTVVTSDALTVTIDDDNETLYDSRDPSEGTVVIPEVPGEGETSVDNTTSVTNESKIDVMLTPILDLLGIDTGTARVASHVVDCEVPVLLPTSVGTS